MSTAMWHTEYAKTGRQSLPRARAAWTDGGISEGLGARKMAVQHPGHKTHWPSREFGAAMAVRVEFSNTTRDSFTNEYH